MIKRVLIWKQNGCQNGRQKGGKLLISCPSHIFYLSTHGANGKKWRDVFTLFEPHLWCSWRTILKKQIDKSVAGYGNQRGISYRAIYICSTVTVHVSICWFGGHKYIDRKMILGCWKYKFCKFIEDSLDYTYVPKSYEMLSGTSFGGQGSICPPLLILKNSDFFVFLLTKFCIFHILPPPP